MELADLSSEQTETKNKGSQVGEISTSQVQQQQEEELEQEEEEGPSWMERHKMTPEKLIKICILAVMLLIIFWFFATSFEMVVFSAKELVKVKVDQPIEEFSGLDEEGFRSFYYYREMEKMARDLVREGKEMDFALIKNKYGDITFSEIFGLFKVLKAIQYAKDYQPSTSSSHDSEDGHQSYDPEEISKPFNYSQYFPPVANQYQCASCYSFPITATVQYLYRKYRNINIKLSEQQLIDCAAEDDLIDGCKDGNITQGFDYVKRVGLVEQDHYPYRSKTGHSYPCRKDVIEDPDIKKYTIDGFEQLTIGDCQAIQAELAKGHTVAAMIAAGQLSYYRQSETRAFRNCPKEPFNHAITIVGQTEKQEWIIRNSWGPSFGQDGYFIMKGGNTCGVCTYAIVPYLKENQ